MRTLRPRLNRAGQAGSDGAGRAEAGDPWETPGMAGLRPGTRDRPRKRAGAGGRRHAMEGGCHGRPKTGPRRSPGLSTGVLLPKALVKVGNWLRLALLACAFLYIDGCLHLLCLPLRRADFSHERYIRQPREGGSNRVSPPFEKKRAMPMDTTRLSGFVWFFSASHTTRGVSLTFSEKGTSHSSRASAKSVMKQSSPAVSTRSATSARP